MAIFHLPASIRVVVAYLVSLSGVTLRFALGDSSLDIHLFFKRTRLP
ncbi:MAG: hypothetical protein IPM23_05395 [Candidatus Melainabacteria bacterium]|nr:hypothetical protein [Candidatus Melainabacteria bacterium]